MSKRARQPSLPPGGFQQKRRWSSDGPPAEASEEHLATLLVRKWAWGDLSTPAIQEIAAAAVADGASSKQIVILAGLGSSGRFPNHMYSELMTKLKPCVIRNSLAEFSLCLRRPPKAIIQVSQPMLLPHVLFATLYHNHRERFVEALCGGSVERIPAFWSAMQGSNLYERNPVKTFAGHKERCIPLSIHGDGVPITGVGKSWSKSVEVFSWSSLLSHGATIKTSFLIWGFFWHLVIKQDGLNAYQKFSKILCWSFEALLSGKWPLVNPFGRPWAPGSVDANRAGTPLADGFFACLYLVKGDLDFMAKAFGLAWATSLSPCSLCRCNASDTPWTDGRQTAAWRRTIWGATDWAASRPDRHPLFKLQGVSILSFVPDVLHTMHLGTYQYAFASVLKTLTHYSMGGTIEQNLAQVWESIRSYYREHNVPVRFSDIKPSMYAGTDASFPTLKGKAAEVRHLAAPLLFTFEKYMTPRNEQHKLMRVLLQIAVRLEQLLDDNKTAVRFPAADAGEWAKGCAAFVQINAALAHHFHGQGVFLFHHTIKFHYMLHLGLLGADINPRVAWCYAGEDLMHRTKLLVQKCTRGTPAHLVVAKAMAKYAVGLGINMEQDIWKR